MIFVVDSNDKERIFEAKEELMRMLGEDELRDAVLLIFANKQVNIINKKKGYIIFVVLLYKLLLNSYFRICLMP